MNNIIALKRLKVNDKFITLMMLKEGDSYNSYVPINLLKTLGEFRSKKTVKSAMKIARVRTITKEDIEVFKNRNIPAMIDKVELTNTLQCKELVRLCDSFPNEPVEVIEYVDGCYLLKDDDLAAHLSMSTTTAMNCNIISRMLNQYSSKYKPIVEILYPDQEWALFTHIFKDSRYSYTPNKEYPCFIRYLNFGPMNNRQKELNYVEFKYDNTILYDILDFVFYKIFQVPYSVLKTKVNYDENNDNPFMLSARLLGNMNFIVLKTLTSVMNSISNIPEITIPKLKEYNGFDYSVNPGTSPASFPNGNLIIKENL